MQCENDSSLYTDRSKILLSGLNCEDVLPTSAPAPPPRARPSSGLLHAARVVASNKASARGRTHCREMRCMALAPLLQEGSRYLPPCHDKVLRDHEKAIAHLKTAEQHQETREHCRPLT